MGISRKKCNEVLLVQVGSMSAWIMKHLSSDNWFYLLNIYVKYFRLFCCLLSSWVHKSLYCKLPIKLKDMQINNSKIMLFLFCCNGNGFKMERFHLGQVATKQYIPDIVISVFLHCVLVVCFCHCICHTGQHCSCATCIALLHVIGWMPFINCITISLLFLFIGDIKSCLLSTTCKSNKMYSQICVRK